jgi:hypothetical protein
MFSPCVSEPYHPPPKIIIVDSLRLARVPLGQDITRQHSGRQTNGPPTLEKTKEKLFAERRRNELHATALSMNQTEGASTGVLRRETSAVLPMRS